MKVTCLLWLNAFWFVFPSGPVLQAAEVPRYFEIMVVDQENGWPVPLVELRTTHNVRFVTDNSGRISFDLPELMGVETWFDILGQGYAVSKDGFGYSGVRLVPEVGKSRRVEVRRTVLAKRMGRLTGAGIFGEAQKLGLETNWRESRVLGSDSVQNVVHKGRLFWVWGDTTMARYPLGIFNGTGAWTEVNPLKSLEPPLRLELNYVKGPNGMPRGVAEIPGEGPTWLTGLASLPDKEGKARLVAAYAKIKPPLDAYQWGLTVWNEERDSYEPFKVIWTKSEKTPKAPPVPEGHPVIWSDDEGKRWLLFGNPFPRLKCPATFEAWQEPERWQVIEPPASLKDSGSERSVKSHSGSIAWNEFRQRWVTIFMESFGKPSAFGELWYAEATSPFGPWGTAVKVLSHDHYTFYNPRIHPEFTSGNSSHLFFEGTYTIQFSDGKQPTPRYDYNQVLYRLDLDDAGLVGARVN